MGRYSQRKRSSKAGKMRIDVIKDFFDTSVLVAAFWGDHINHESSLLKAIRNPYTGLSWIEIPGVSCDEQRVVETCGGPDDCVGEFEFVFLAELNRFASDRFIKLNNWKQAENTLPDSSQCVGRCANEHFHPGDPADRDALVTRQLFGGRCDTVEVVN